MEGGLISGVSNYIKETDPRIEVISRGRRSALFEAGGPSNCQKSISLVDGIAVKSGQLPYEGPVNMWETLVAVDEGLISETLIDLLPKQGIVAEPAGWSV